MFEAEWSVLDLATADARQGDLHQHLQFLTDVEHGHPRLLERRLKIKELAAQHSGRHVVVLPSRHPLENKGFLTIQVQNLQTGQTVPQEIPVALLKGGAGHKYGPHRSLPQTVGCLSDSGQPGPAIFVAQRMPLSHPLDIAQWMKIVGIEPDTIARLCQCTSQRRFAATRYPHHQPNRLCCLHRRYPFRKL